MSERTTVFRVQDKEGRGPFRPGFSHRWLDEDGREDERPPIYVELGMGIFNRILTGESAGCACLSLDALLRWFTPAELERLEGFGYHVVSLDADRIIAESKTQVLFGRAKPLRTGATRIKWREMAPIK